jgi:hypothetical protein
VPIWEIRCDGAWGRKGAGIAAIVTSPTGIKLRYAARLDYKDPSDRIRSLTVGPSQSESPGGQQFHSQV